MRIYNSQTRKKEELIPQTGNKVGIYACGPTVYDFFHIGNARPFIIFDVFRRYLQHKGYDVTFVQNFTDIDDKVIKRANAEGITIQELTERYIAAYYEDAKALGIRPADVHPKATEHMPQIIDIIKRLIEKGRAYEVNGDVYFRVKAFPGYGKLSGQDMEELEEGASERLNVETEKEDPRDFVLWKKQKPGEPAWESPWGMGRPGWHIECSAMTMTYFGDTVDIHCGGKDLLFPHHENEIAQSEGATDKPYVRYWMHNGFINIDNEKMAKSKGNFFTVRDILKEYDAENVRMFMLSAHYRSPVNFSREQIAQAQASLERLYIARDQMLFLLEAAQEKPLTKEEDDFMLRIEKCVKRFDLAMDDDLNTADALGALFEIVKDVNVSLNEKSAKQAVQFALDSQLAICDILGLLMKKPDALPKEIQDMVDNRAKARKDKNWKLSDELRDAIKAKGYILEDTAAGQKVRKG